MRKLLVLLFSSLLLLGVSSTPGQEKKPPTTLEEDWKVLCRFQWVNSDPKEAWALLPKDSKDFNALALGNMGWSRIDLSLYESSSFQDAGRETKEYHITARWYYLDAKGKEKTHPALYGVKTHLQEEKGERFLLRGQSKIKYELKEGVLILNGVEDWGKGSSPFVYTGTYKGVERKEKK
jgi:hypothetical protein